MEPEILHRGKEFHRRVQEDWLNTAEGAIRREHTILFTGGQTKLGRARKGRLDLFVAAVDGFVTVVEIKSTDWDSVKAGNRKRLMSAHRRQVWRYINEHLDVANVDVCPGLIYPSPPSTPGLKQEIEAHFNDHGLQVVWFDE